MKNLLILCFVLLVFRFLDKCYRGIIYVFLLECIIYVYVLGFIKVGKYLISRLGLIV